MAADEQVGPWAEPLPEDQAAEEEIRFATVLNGGVSLAIWIGGVVRELDRLTRRDGVYDTLLQALHSRARVDIIGGTSAGGINGAFLALTQTYPDADLGELRDVWATEASMTRLLHSPWVGQPASLMQGDDVFWPALRHAFARLLRVPGARLPRYRVDWRPIELVIPTTLLTPTARTVVDVLGTVVQQPVRRGRFTFRRRPPDRDDLAPTGDHRLADRLALASRCTASFPAAFEPFFVPVESSRSTTHATELQAARPADDERPVMSTELVTFGQSRWVVDGGVLMNTPLQPVLDAIAAAPATVQTRRVLLLVVPDPYLAPGEARESERDQPVPGIAQVLGGIVTAWQAATFEQELDQLEQHNRDTSMRRAARADLLDWVEVSRLLTQAKALWPGYRAIRMRRAALAIATLLAEEAEDPGRPIERLTDEVLAAMTARTPEQTAPRSVPFVPDEWPEDAAPASPIWPWGVAMLERLGGAVLDLLRQTMWLLGPDEQAKADLQELRGEFYEVLDDVRRFRGADSDYWSEQAATLLRGPEVTPEAMRTALDGWSVGAGTATRTPAEAAADLLRIAHDATRLVPDEARVEALHGGRVARLATVFADADADRRLRTAEALEVCYVCLVDQGQSGLSNDHVVELVSVSAGVDLHVAGAASDPRERVAGLHLGHFAAFLKQAWRINDWTWGRIAGADRLVTTLLDPSRLRRLVVLAGGEPRAAAADLVTRLLGTSTMDADDGDRLVDALATDGAAHATVRTALAPLVTAIVTDLAEQIVADEEPALRAAVDADRAAHDDTNSRGAAWLRGHPGRRTP